MTFAGLSYGIALRRGSWVVGRGSRGLQRVDFLAEVQRRRAERFSQSGRLAARNGSRRSDPQRRRFAAERRAVCTGRADARCGTFSSREHRRRKGALVDARVSSVCAARARLIDGIAVAHPVCGSPSLHTKRDRRRAHSTSGTDRAKTQCVDPIPEPTREKAPTTNDRRPTTEPVNAPSARAPRPEQASSSTPP